LVAFLADRLAEAHGRWPDVRLDDVAFVNHLARHLPAGDLLSTLSQVRIADLFLACACAGGDVAALQGFEETFSGELRIVKARLRKSAAEADDFAQGCRQRLFAPPRPKIGDYSGQGDLRNWLRVTLVRMLVDHQRSTRQRDAREQLSEPASPAFDVPTSEHDMELDFLKQKYGAEFRAAFEQAAMALSPADRNLLRQHFSDGLTVDDIGALHNVHRATAARRVAKARAQLFDGTRRVLMNNLGLSRSELDSVMRMIESNVHVSVHRILNSPPS
jgi:RNA polymerase sigma-70 factor (ECF subfamily)